MELSRQDMEIILTRVNSYADEILPERDPSKVPIRVQLEALKPEMENLAQEFEVAIEDVFIAYMDMNTETSAKAEADLQERMNMEM